MMTLNKLAPLVKRWFDEGLTLPAGRQVGIGIKLISGVFDGHAEIVPVRIAKQNLFRNKK